MHEDRLNDHCYWLTRTTLSVVAVCRNYFIAATIIFLLQKLFCHCTKLILSLQKLFCYWTRLAAMGHRSLRHIVALSRLLFFKVTRWSKNLWPLAWSQNGLNCCRVPLITLSCSFFCSDVYACDSNPCQHEGTCTEGYRNYTCSCPPGFEGIHCEESEDEHN